MTSLKSAKMLGLCEQILLRQEREKEGATSQLRITKKIQYARSHPLELRKEKKAFEYLIKEKSSLVVDADQQRHYLLGTDFGREKSAVSECN